MITTRLVSVGAAGWDRPEWRGSFYPDDLPVDWLLPYYNAHFQAVYLPFAAWQAATDENWSRWLDDTDADFVFVLEPGGPSPRLPRSARVVLAVPDWAAAHLWWLEDAPDLRALAQCIGQHAATGEPLFVFSRQGDLARLEQVANLRQVMGY